DRNCRGRRLGHKSRWCVGRSGDHCNPASNQFGYQFRQPVELILGPAIFDRDVSALSKPRFAQTLSAAHQVLRIVRVPTFAKRQQWHWALLRMRDERPSGYTTTNSFDEIAASHCPARGLGPRQSCDYIRDLRWAEWGQIIILRGNNPQERMSALGQKQT